MASLDTLSSNQLGKRPNRGTLLGEVASSARSLTLSSSNSPSKIIFTGRATVPPSILRQKASYVIYAEDYDNEFEEWFRETPYMQAVSAQTHGDKIKHPKWNSPFRKRENDVSLWDFYWEGASLLDGSPSLICCACSQILRHPTAYGGGTSNMKRHIQTGSCKALGKRDSSGQLKIDHILKIKRVRYSSTREGFPRRAYS
jgi:hypothetical protein